MKSGCSWCWCRFCSSVLFFLAVVVLSVPNLMAGDITDDNWESMGGYPGTNGDVSAMVFRNGKLYIGGDFTAVNRTFVNNVAMWDGSSWSTLGEGINGTVSALAFDSSGNLYAGGSFTTAGGVSAKNIAKWNGTSWSALGTGMDGIIYALACDSTGNLYAGGDFTTAGGVSAKNIAKWNGTSWSALGTGLVSYYSFVHSLSIDSTGNLYAAGKFTEAGGISVSNIAKWNPKTSTWSALGTGINGDVNAITFDSTGNLYAGGYFTTAGGVSAKNIAKWNGTSWSALVEGWEGISFGTVYSLACDSSGNLYAGGKYIYKWNGSTWTGFAEMGGEIYHVNALSFDSTGNLYAGGDFRVAGDITPGEIVAFNIAKWNKTSWSALGAGIDEEVLAVACDSAGNLYAGGNFNTAGGTQAMHIAKWNSKNSTWSSLGTGIDEDGTIYALACDSTGNLYAGGFFGNIDGIQANCIAKWNPKTSTWSTLGEGINGTVFALAFDSTGNLYVGGIFSNAGDVSAKCIAKWDPKTSTWSALGAGTNERVTSLAFDSTGNLYAGGYFNTVGDISVSNIAKWNPKTSTWSALGTGTSWVYALACDSSGNLYAGGSFTTAGGVSAKNIAKWNGTSWSALGTGVSGDVNALAFDSSGNLYVGGWFTTAGGVSAKRIAKWNGANWSALGTGMDDGVSSLAFDSSDILYAGGSFTKAGGKISTYLAKCSIGGGGTTYNVTFMAGSGGSITGNASQTIVSGGSCTAVTAVPDANYTFVNWTGDYTGTQNPLTIINVTKNMAITANFSNSIDNANLTMAVSPASSGTTSPTIGSHSVAKGIAQNITAIPAEGYNFVNWTFSGGATVANANFASTTVTLSADGMVTANFYVNEYTVTFELGDKGTRIGGGELVQTVNYRSGATAPLVTGNLGWAFTGWDMSFDDIVSDLTVTAQYTASATYTVTFVEGKNGTISGTKVQTVNEGTNCTAVTAVGNTYSQFVGWTGDYTGTENPLIITNVTSDMTITANFEHEKTTLTMAVSPADKGTTTPVIGENSVDTMTNIPITATPIEGWLFAEWTVSGTGTIADSTKASTTVNLNTATTVTANFTKIPDTATMSISVNPADGGTTAPLAGTIVSVKTMEAQNISATPATGYKFVNWTAYPESFVVFGDKASASTTATFCGSATITANFKPLKYIAVTSPNGGEHWQGGTSHQITWETDGVAGNVKIELLKSGQFDSEITSGTKNNGSYGWNIPELTASAKGISAGSFYSLKISSVEEPAVSAVSNSYFSISNTDASITVTSPTDGVNWQLGTTQAVTWTSTGTIESVNVKLYKAGVYVNNLAMSEANDGSYDWAIPDAGLQSGTDYTMQISDSGNPSAKGTSGQFTLNSTGTTAMLTMAVNTEAGGKVTPNLGEHTVNTNQAVLVTAEPSEIYKFVYWKSNSANAKIADSKSTATEVVLTGDATVTAMFTMNLIDTFGSGSKIKISMDNTSQNKDSVSIMNGRLPTDFQKPEAGSAIIIYIDDYALDMTNAMRKDSGKKLSYSGQTGIAKYSLTLDLKKFLWSFKLAKANLSAENLVDSFDGVDVILQLGTTMLGQNVSMDEVISWKYNSEKNGVGTALETTGDEWTNFGIKKADGKRIATKLNSDQFSVGQGLGDALADFTIADSVIFTVDDYEINLDDANGEWKQSGVKYTYKGLLDGTAIQFLLDFTAGKENWKIKLSKADFEYAIDGMDGLDVFLQVGNYEGGLRIKATQKTALTYPQK